MPPSAVMSLFEWCTKKCFSRAKEHPAFLRTRSLVNTTSHMVSGIVHQEVLRTCLFHVRQEQRVSSSASLVKRPDDRCSRVSGPHAPSVVAAQQKLHRSSPAVRVAAVRVAQDGQVSSSGAGRGPSPIAPCRYRCRCSFHTEQGGVVPSMTDQVLGTANLLGQAPIRWPVTLKTSGNDGEADRRSCHVDRSEHNTHTRDDTRKRSREALRPPQPGWK